ncbi:phosphoadenosine phosphosulfate reductase family protein [Candidatus Bathyarchaeota archaeon]|nr:phosphoadenosine phosphosulfate reductase family protein [Candidatus Bathyarchaeota archaeon]
MNSVSGISYSQTRSNILRTNKEKPVLELWKTKPDECCRIFKVEPTREAVKDLDTWISDLRRTKDGTRSECREVEKRGNIVKITPYS